jgi:hypothetical protein
MCPSSGEDYDGGNSVGSDAKLFFTIDPVMCNSRRCLRSRHLEFVRDMDGHVACTGEIRTYRILVRCRWR